MKRKLDKVTFSKIRNGEVIEQPEWCFKFNDDEPVVFAAFDEPITNEKSDLIIKIPSNTLSNVVFKQGNNTFTIFPREMTIIGKKMIKKTTKKSEK